jgi:Bacterial Ig-like domain (group 2)/Galactose oxidase, central domain
MGGNEHDIGLFGIAKILAQNFHTARGVHVLVVLGLAGYFCGCGSKPLSLGPPISIAITPENTSIVAVGNTLAFAATGIWSDGSRQNLTDTVTWRSSDPSVATISNASGSQGLTTATGGGTTRIEAASGAINGSTSLTVSLGFIATGSLSTARYYHTATLLNNGSVLIAGGVGSSGILASAELYNRATGTFTRTGNLNAAREYHTATLLNNGKVLIAGGYNVSGHLGHYIVTAELYDPATGTFTPSGNLHTGRTFHSATLLNNGMVLIAGGFGSGGLCDYIATAELYDPATGTFTSTGSLNTAGIDRKATLLDNGMLLIAGGYNCPNRYLAGAELYGPATGTFTPSGNLHTARYLHTATLLNDGFVLIVGGEADYPFYLASAELYDPATGAFTSTGSLNTARLGHTATLLSNGMVLIVGGSNLGGDIATAERYDPATGAFTPAGTLNTARSGPTATRLDNGMVLIAGGSNSSNRYLASAELY